VRKRVAKDGEGGRPCRGGILEFAQDGRGMRTVCRIFPDFMGLVLLPRGPLRMR